MGWDVGTAVALSILRFYVDRSTLRHGRRRSAGAAGPAPGRPAGGSHAAAHAGRDDRAGARAWRGVGAAERDRERQAAQRDPLRAARGGEDDAGADRRGGGRRGLRGGVGGQRRQSRDPRGDRAGAGAAAGQRAADDPLPRRDPPLQQGPAGRAAAGGRGRAPDPDRGDDREPLLRGQLGAALAGPGLRAAAAGAGPGGRAAAAGAGRPRARDRRPAGRHPRGAGDAGDAQRRRRPGRALGAWSGRSSVAARARSASPRSKTPCSARRSTTTARATATTTSSRPGSRRPAAPTSTPRSTTWR